ncbi:MAG: DJ-1/PfpI family protein [Nitrospinota bacterium]|nr:DJ-1/PfpI family protein [Nitrospinota bacterium]MDH5677979.1 DJ-1/PfpI family protein [Nitrospinota bacterium]
MTEVLMVAAPEKFRDEELAIPRQTLEAKGARVTVASTRPGVITGMLGATAQATDIQQAVGQTFDAIIIVGGAGAPAALWENITLRQIIRHHVGAKKVVGAICLAGAALAKAGALEGVEATVFKTEDSMKVYKELGVIFREKPVVVSGRMITANGPAAAREFALAICSALGL